MAKDSNALVAKVSFDDGTKKNSAGKGDAYNIGEVYLGKDPKNAIKEGLVCKASELEVSKAAVDDANAAAKKFEAKHLEALKVITVLENENAGLKEEIEAMKADLKAVKK